MKMYEKELHYMSKPSKLMKERIVCREKRLHLHAGASSVTTIASGRAHERSNPRNDVTGLQITAISMTSSLRQ